MTPKKLTLAQRRAVECAIHGHPPVVEVYFGYVHCGRCGAQIGDRWGGVFDTTNTCVIGHDDCQTCRAVWKKLTPDQRRLTPNPFRKKAVR